MPTLTLSELQTAAVAVKPPNWSIINNPYLKMYNELAIANKIAVQAAIERGHVPLLIEEPDTTGQVIPRINETALLPCLWPQLTRQQQQALVPDIRNLCKKSTSTQAIKTMSVADLELLFAGYDLGNLDLAWPELQALLLRFSSDRQRHYVQHYFQRYQHTQNQTQFLGQWQQFLTPLTTDERYWVITHLSVDQFNLLFAELDFLFSFLTDDQKVNVVRRIDSEYLKNYLGCHFKGDLYLLENLARFLELFAITDRVTVVSLFTPEQLYYFISIAYQLDQILPVFAETDRVTFLLYLGQDLLASIYFDYGSDVNYRIVDIFQFLPENQRLLFLKQGIAKTNLISANKYWSNITWLVKFLPDEDVLNFFNYLGADAISIFIKKIGIAWTVADVPASKQLSYLKFIQQSFPGLLNDSFVLMIILNYLPQTDHVAFFDLFSEADLRTLYQSVACLEKSATLGLYLQNITTNIVKPVRYFEQLSYPNQILSCRLEPMPVIPITNRVDTSEHVLLKTTINTSDRPHPLTPFARLDTQLAQLSFKTPNV